MPIDRRRPYAATFGSAFHYAGRAFGLTAKYFKRNNGGHGRRGTVRNFLSTRRYGKEPPCDANLSGSEESEREISPSPSILRTWWASLIINYSSSSAMTVAKRIENNA